MRIVCRVRGVPDIVANLDKYDEDTQKRAKRVLRKSLVSIRRGAKSRIHNVTGTLSKRINNSYNSDGLGGLVRSRAPHSHLVEFGTKPHGQEPRPRSRALRIAGKFFEKITHPGSKPHPFMQPAYYAERNNYINNLKKAVRYQE